VTAPDRLSKLHDCPVLWALAPIIGKWKTRILWLLRGGAMHFGDLRKTLPGVSAKVLDEQLKQLERDGLITRSETMQGGVKYVFYAYSDHGRSLIPLLDGLGDWGLAHQSRQAPNDGRPYRGI
jgi:DNA-binding HxlR family transcriptional regulator